MNPGPRPGAPAPSPERISETWRPGPARPGGDWSHTTLIAETRRFVEARNLAHNPPLPDRAARPARAARSGAERRKTQRPSQARQRIRNRYIRAALLLLGGLVVLLLDVVSLHCPPDALFYLSLMFGTLLMVQGLRLLPWFS